MRLSDWRGEAPTRDAMSQNVMAVIKPVLHDLGCAPDPDCWVAWGDDPASRYSVLVPTSRGLVSCHVRVNVPGEGPRAMGKLVRWAKVQLGEFSVEMAQGHRVVTGQLEGLILRGVDDSAERAGAFMVSVCDAIDGRVAQPPTRTGTAAPRKGASGARSTRSATSSRSSARGAPASIALPSPKV